MAYTLFASNLVDYNGKYPGMQSAVMHELEGFANVQLTTKESGVWTVPPYCIDSVTFLAGFIMNCSDAMDTQNNYCVTPGWKTMRFAKPLVPGAKYRSYVKMIPTVEDPTICLGDVYIMQGYGLVGAPDKTAFKEGKPKDAACQARLPAPATPKAAAPKPTAPEPKPALSDHDSRSRSLDDQRQSPPASLPSNAPALPTDATPVATDAAARSVESAAASGSITAKALLLISTEAALEVSGLEDEANFAELGVDSLMSLVIAGKFRIELNVKVGGSLFLDYPTIGDLRN